MKNRQSNRWIRFLSAAVAAAMMFALAPAAWAEEGEEPENTVLINEIESNDADGGNDWVEIINVGETAVDISGWFLTDDGGLDRLTEGSALPIGEDTVLEPGGILVLEENTDFTFGLGKADTVTLYNADSQVMDTYSWTAHAAGTYSRVPGSTEFVDQAPTKGAPNIVTTDPDPDPDPEDPEDKPEPEAGPVVINEVESNGDETDWVEIYNRGLTAVDISGWYLLDNDPEGHAEEVTPVEEGTILEPGAFFVFDQNIHFTFGLGAVDQVTIFDKDGAKVAEFAWTAHAEEVYARIPDGFGELAEYGTATKGVSNLSPEPPHTHDYAAVVTDPTCGEPGYTTYTCTICGDSYKDDFTAPTGQHTYQDDSDATCEVCGFIRLVEPEQIETVPMYRLYNPNTGEHFYTGSTTERDLLQVMGWNYEGVAWNAPVFIGEPVYRLFDPESGDHHYTMSQEEVDNLRAAGWRYESVAWNSVPANHEESVPQYRMYNPNVALGCHSYTSSMEEKETLMNLGWQCEGIGWFGLLK